MNTNQEPTLSDESLNNQTCKDIARKFFELMRKALDGNFYSGTLIS